MMRIASFARVSVAALSAALSTLAFEAPAHALDKQGSAHGGNVEAADDGFGFSGSLTLGSAIYNPTYAARPDNTGLALMRYAGHADVDILGRKLSIPLDFNMFTDRERKGGLVFVPSELDLIGGVTSTWDALGGAIEGGVRFEHDRPIDMGSYTQSYVDARVRYLYSAKEWAPRLGTALCEGDVSGYVTLGGFVFNPTYAARPDNSGSALLRYVFHGEVSAWHEHVGLGVDTTFFTDRRENPVVPSELDLTPEIIGRLDPFELHVAYERDMPVDRGGLVQHFLYALVVWSFDTGK
jgi:hypothetical protein